MIDALIDRVIRREGGYVDHPADRGGPTNMGITLRTLAAWRGHSVSAEDVQALTRAEATHIYRSEYWAKPGFTRLKVCPVIADMIFDAGVHHGPMASARMLQRAAGVTADGMIGPITRKAVDSLPGPRLASRFMAERVADLGRIITNNPSQAVFAHGWMRRCGEMIRTIPEAI